MDYHAWMILMRSLEYRDYGEEINRGFANPRGPGRLTAAAARLVRRISARLGRGRENLERKTAPRSGTDCHAC
jgi:hypothetical protein